MTDTAVASTPAPPRGTHLTARQQEALRSLLEDRLLAHRERAAQASTVLEDFTSGDSPHDREIARDAAENRLEDVREHEAALARLEANTYGVCGVCRRPIPFERLDAIPEVNHCVNCVRLG